MGALEGKVAVVSGASSGSGLGVARRFVAEGARVFMLARGRERLIQHAGDLGESAVPIVTDVGDPESVRTAFAHIATVTGSVDILVNNAGVYRPCAVEELTDDEVHQQVCTNFLGPVYTARAAIPLLRAAGGGDIVNTSSEATLHPFPMLSMYVATKAALEAFGRVLSQEIQGDDIRVTTVIQGTAIGAGGGSSGWSWDPDQTNKAMQLWSERGLLSQAFGRYGGQDVDAVGEVHVFIVTRPRTQKLDTIHVRSF
ncbi:MAG TPA: SDR family oxidoreductase [Acidimicrobiales bacterium]|nr:SDR family oxidoreductase [Acidimicrobiales bacterium]